MPSRRAGFLGARRRKRVGRRRDQIPTRQTRPQAPGRCGPTLPRMLVLANNSLCRRAPFRPRPEVWRWARESRQQHSGARGLTGFHVDPGLHRPLTSADPCGVGLTGRFGRLHVRGGGGQPSIKGASAHVAFCRRPNLLIILPCRVLVSCTHRSLEYLLRDVARRSERAASADEDPGACSSGRLPRATRITDAQIGFCGR